MRLWHKRPLVEEEGSPAAPILGIKDWGNFGNGKFRQVRKDGEDQIAECNEGVSAGY